MDREAHWQNVYQNKAEDAVSWYQDNPQVSLSLIQNCQLEKNAGIIDIGGGASVLVDKLIEASFSNLTVLDISSAALEKSKRRLVEKAEQVNWIVQDIIDFRSSKPLQLWHDRAVFHFLTDEKDRSCYVKNLDASISTGGQVIIASFALGGPEKCSGLPIIQYDESKMIETLGARFEFVESKNEVHLTPWQSEQSFKYFRFLKK